MYSLYENKAMYQLPSRSVYSRLWRVNDIQQLSGKLPIPDVSTDSTAAEPDDAWSLGCVSTHILAVIPTWMILER